MRNRRGFSAFGAGSGVVVLVPDGEFVVLMRCFVAVSPCQAAGVFLRLVSLGGRHYSASRRLAASS
jgi:hypothetical protein